jgi:hypothetical protein
MHGDDTTSNLGCAVVIPALNPVAGLVNLVRDLLQRGIPRIIVVNDGSDLSFDGVFDALAGVDGCTVLSHDRNLGKGRALKTAFGHFLERFASLDGVVTADADGQHAVDDIVAVCRRVSAGDGSLVLGMRNLHQGNVPKSNHFGNTLTSAVFRLFFGTYIEDTQTGLRGIPTREIRWMATMQGDRYEYEMNMLINAKRRSVPLSGLRIQTLYPDGNANSHYQVLGDSARIFARMMAGLAPHIVAAIVSGLADILLFLLFDSLLLASMGAAVRLLASTVLARVVSLAVKLLANRRLFSVSGRTSGRIAARYYALQLVKLIASWSLVYGITRLVSVHDIVVKVFVDLALGLLNSQLQLRWAFGNRDVMIAAG